MSETATKSSNQRSRKWVAVVLAAAATAGIALSIHRYRLRESAQAVAEEPPALQLLHLETFVVNLSDDNHTFLRIGIDLGVQSSPASAEKEKAGNADTAIVRDTLVALLSSLSTTDLGSPPGRQKLKQDILNALNTRVPHLGVREIYITEFLIQR